MDAGALQHVARPQRVLALVEDLAVELLTPQSRAGILRDDAFQKGRRKIGGVLARQRARHDARRMGDQLFQKRQRTRRRRDELTRPVAETQAKLQHVPCLPGVAPFGEFVAPGGVKLRPAQAFRIFRRKRLRHGARVPDDTLSRRLPARPLARRMHGEQAGDAFDHHVAHVGRRLADKRDAPERPRRKLRASERKRFHPFGAGAGLARAASAEDQPCAPRRAARGQVRRPLIAPRDEFPLVEKPRQFSRAQTFERLIQSALRRAGAQAVEQAPRGVRPIRGAARRRLARSRSGRCHRLRRSLYPRARAACASIRRAF